MDYTVIKSFDNEELFLKIYKAENAKACVQIIHGMMEHQNRYIELANRLVEEGYTVVTSDLRGHGENAKELGFFKEKDGFKALILDQVEITKYIKNTLEINDVILYGHSMGSIIARDVIYSYSDLYKKVILSGYPNYNPFVVIGYPISKFIMLFKGKHGTSKMLHNIALKPFEKSIKNAKTKLDWLSINEDNVSEYINDPLCGFEFKNQAYNDLFHLLSLLGRVKNGSSMLPILLLNGKCDPCVGKEKGIKSTKKILKSQGFNNITHIEYPSFRHEIFKEKDNDLVYNDFINFIEA